MKKSSIIPILFILVALCMRSITIHADIVKGRVVDAETKEPLPEAQLTFNNLDDGWVWAYLKSDSLGCFSINARGRNTVTAEMLGYYSKTKTFLAFSDNRKDTLDLGDIELTMSSQMLKMVEVKGHARRFTVKGDTIVFHPEAFHLQEGARLDDRLGDRRVQTPYLAIGDRRRLFEKRKAVDHLRMQAEPRDAEVFHRAERLHPVIGVFGNRLVADGIMLCPICLSSMPSLCLHDGHACR